MSFQQISIEETFLQDSIPSLASSLEDYQHGMEPLEGGVDLSDVVVDIETELQRETECDLASYRHHRGGKTRRGGRRADHIKGRRRAGQKRSRSPTAAAVDQEVTQRMNRSVAPEEDLEEVGRCFEIDLNDIAATEEAEVSTKDDRDVTDLDRLVHALAEAAVNGSSTSSRSLPETIKDKKNTMGGGSPCGGSNQAELMGLQKATRRRSYVGRCA